MRAMFLTAGETIKIAVRKMGRGAGVGVDVEEGVRCDFGCF